MYRRRGLRRCYRDRVAPDAAESEGRRMERGGAGRGLRRCYKAGDRDGADAACAAATGARVCVAAARAASAVVRCLWITLRRYRTSSSSTSNTSTLCGGMLPTPWAP